MNPEPYEVNWTVLVDWADRAFGPAGCTFQTIGQVNTSITTACQQWPDKLISGSPNRIAGTIVYWTAHVDHDKRTIRITHIEPDPRQGL